jgi:hypothetical protein
MCQPASQRRGCLMGLTGFESLLRALRIRRRCRRRRAKAQGARMLTEPICRCGYRNGYRNHRVGTLRIEVISVHHKPRTRIVSSQNIKETCVSSDVAPLLYSSRQRGGWRAGAGCLPYMPVTAYLRAPTIPAHATIHMSACAAHASSTGPMPERGASLMSVDS